MGMPTWVSIKYSTHLPVLMEVMNRTSGDVLELGPGVFSTPVLHWMCEARGRDLLTIESDSKWSWFCKQYFDTEHHKHLYFPNWDDADAAINKEWDVVLVDHSPSGRRVVEIRKLANLAKYIVVHDSEPNKDREYHYSTIYPLFKYRYDFTDAVHNVVLLSNYIDLKGFSWKK